MIGLGEASALGTALMWACSSMIFGGTRLSAWSINLAKNTVGATLCLITLAGISLVTAQPLLQVSFEAQGWLILSGFIGLTIGDTFYFRSLQILGPRRSLVMATATPIFGAMLGWMILGEGVTAVTAVGIAITISGLAIVIMERRANVESPGLYPGRIVLGVLAGIGGAFCQATGGAFSKIGMRDCTHLEATYYRLAIAVAFALVFTAARGRFGDWTRAVTKPETARRVAAAATLGTFLGIWFSQIAIKMTSLAVATTLMSASPLFAIPLVRYFHGHRVSKRAILGNLVAIAGIVLVVARDW